MGPLGEEGLVGVQRSVDLSDGTLLVLIVVEDFEKLLVDAQLQTNKHHRVTCDALSATLYASQPLRVPRVSRCRRTQLPRRTARSTACVRRSFKRVRPGPPVRPMQVLVPAAPNHEPLVLLAGGWPTELPTATPV